MVNKKLGFKIEKLFPSKMSDAVLKSQIKSRTMKIKVLKERLNINSRFLKRLILEKKRRDRKKK